MTTSHKVGDYAGVDRPEDAERERLRDMSRSLNPTTQGWMDRLGIAPGWSCLEIGAAEGSMSRWMADQVGPTGRVVAADIDVRFLADMDRPNVEVRELDLRTDPLEADTFDLAYCRTLLLHLPDPRAALERMIAALKPGGWLLAQEPDMGTILACEPDDPEAARFEELTRRVFDHCRDTKLFDTRFGRTLPVIFRSLDLVDVDGMAAAPVQQGGTPDTLTTTRTFEVLGDHFIEQDVVTRAELDDLLRLWADPRIVFVSALQVGAWGRRAPR